MQKTSEIRSIIEYSIMLDFIILAVNQSIEKDLKDPINLINEFMHVFAENLTQIEKKEVIEKLKSSIDRKLDKISEQELPQSEIDAIINSLID